MAALTDEAVPSPAGADEEEEQTPEQRLAYLRAHGVQVELSPSEQRAAAAAAAAAPPPAADGPWSEVKYVRIPCDGSQPYEELVARFPSAELPAGDSLPELVKPRFSGAGQGLNEATLAEHARRQFGDDAAGVNPKAMRQATIDGSVETFALARPADANRFEGVYIYLDEVGVLKQLPLNTRGSALAAACGHQGVQLHGDLFVGRVATKPAPMRNKDFTVADLDSESPWLKAAPGENYQYNMALQEMQDQLNVTGNVQHVNTGRKNGELPSGEAEDGLYSWNQTSDEVEVSVASLAGLRGRDVAVTISRVGLVVKRKADAADLFALELFADVHTDDSTWTIGGDGLVVTMEKAREHTWPQLTKVAS